MIIWASLPNRPICDLPNILCHKEMRLVVAKIHQIHLTTQDFQPTYLLKEVQGSAIWFEYSCIAKLARLQGPFWECNRTGSEDRDTG